MADWRAPESSTLPVLKSSWPTTPFTQKLAGSSFRDANYNTETGTFLSSRNLSQSERSICCGQGNSCSAHVKGMTRPNAILVPQQAVLQGAKGFFVWIVDKDGKAQTRNIEVGDWQNDNWFVFKGLSAGESVITDGIVHLSVGKPVKILTPDAGHVDGQPNDGKPDVAPAGLEKQKAADN